MQSRRDEISHIEGENDFSGKRYVWLRDMEKAFVKGWIVEELAEDRLLVQCDDGDVRLIAQHASNTMMADIYDSNEMLMRKA